MDGRPPGRVRHSSSQYDFVKLRVWLGEGEDRHATVLSRFLLCRTLTAAKVPLAVAVKVALEVKKTLVDSDQLDVTQAQLEAVLFRVMRKRAYGDDVASRYRMLAAFHVKRAPLIVLVCGSVCTGKSTIAAALSQARARFLCSRALSSSCLEQPPEPLEPVAQRLNLPNMLQTEVVYEILRSSDSMTWNPAPLWARGDAGVQALLKEYEQECAAVSRGFDGMLRKCLCDGKALVLEGLHCHTAVYLSRIQALQAELGGLCRQPPVVVAMAVHMRPVDRQVLLREWVAKRAAHPDMARLSPEAFEGGVAALDAAVLASGAFSGALAVHFKPAQLSDALDTMHEHVLAALKACVNAP